MKREREREETLYYFIVVYYDSIIKTMSFQRQAGAVEQQLKVEEVYDASTSEQLWVIEK